MATNVKIKNVTSDYKSLTVQDLRILDLMGESVWKISEFQSVQKIVPELCIYLKKRPKLFGMTDTHVWRIFNFNAFEKEILNLLGESSWKIADLLVWLQQKGIKAFRTELCLHNFLKKRPKLFSMTETHVWNAEKIFRGDCDENIESEQIQKKMEHLPSVKTLDPLEIQILTLMDVSRWRISDLRTKLLENGLNTFKPAKQLHNFLKKRPKLFGLTETHVWSLVDHIHTLKKVKIPANKETTSKKKPIKKVKEEEEILALIGTSPHHGAF